MDTDTPEDRRTAGELARTAVRGVLLVAASNGVMSLVAFAGGLYLMERVSPVHFGVVKYAVALLALFQALGNFGFSHGAIHRQERVEETFSAYLVLRLAMAAAMLVLLALVAVLGWGFLSTRTRVEPLVVLGGAVLLNAAADVWSTRLQRDLRFGRLAAVSTVSAVTATGIGVALAASGYGLWALILNRASHALLRVVGLWAARGARTRFRIEGADAAWLFRFGFPLWLGGLATTWVLQYDDLIVGSLLGPTPLGYYDRAYRLALLPLGLVTGVLTRVSMPLYARLQDERQRLSEAFRIVAGTMFRLVAPAAAGLALAIGDLIALMGWQQWEPVIPVLRWLLVYAMVRPMMDDAGGLLTAIGRPKITGHTLLAQAVALLVLCPVMTLAFGAEGAGVSVGVVVVAGLSVWYARFLPRFVEVRYGHILLWPLLAVGVGGAASLGFAAWAGLSPGLAAGALKLAVLAAGYLAALFVLDGRQTVADIRTLCRHAFGRPRANG
jgi:PST family polysaccharide transporter